MKNAILILLSVLCLAATGVDAQDVNVLLIGSTRSFDRKTGSIPLDAKATQTQVTAMLRRDLKVTGRIKIVFENVYRTKTISTAYGQRGSMKNAEYRCHSLAQWYFWPEGRKDRLDSLQGKGATKFDYIVLAGDPWLIANMPGIYAEGVKLIADAAAAGSAKTVLLITMPREKVAEVICRVGNGAEVPAIPSMLANKVKNADQGEYKDPTAFSMKYVEKRNITYNHTGSSSERGIERGLKSATGRCGVKASKKSPKPGEPKIDFNYGRGNSFFEKNKQYKVSPDKFERSYGFPMQDQSKSANTTMLYGIDTRYFDGRQYEDGTDLGIAGDMIKQQEVGKDVRCIPIRLMYAKMHEADPEMGPLGDKWHMSGHLDQASGSFIYTLLSGRCPVGPEPGKDNKKAWRNWLGQKIGYETAWRMSHLTARVPGFTVRPGGSSELMVSLYYKPQKNVTVTVSVDKGDAATVSPAKLTFTPENHATPQKVTITFGEVKEKTTFSVKLVTESEDGVYDKLHDAWPFTAEAK